MATYYRQFLDWSRTIWEWVFPTYRLGYNRDVHDVRDYRITFTLPGQEKLPVKVDLRIDSPYIFNQLSIPSCTANAVCIQFDWIQDRSHKRNPNSKTFIPSRMFLYYNTRKLEGTHLKSTGSSIRNAILSAVNNGVCDEKLWPYDVKKFAIAPPKNCYDNALKNNVTKFARLEQTEYQFKLCLKQGNPFVFGMIIYSSWYHDINLIKKGEVNMPKPSEYSLGGHAMLCVGYDDTIQKFIVQNSWGNTWGDKGYCYIPYKYMLDNKLAWDFWVIKNTSIPDINYTIINPK
jgi:C1A family cysteine protease